MLLLPYRSNKKLESFPYATVALIALNVVVYALTAENFLLLRPEASALFSVSLSDMWSQPWRMFTALFLHGTLTQIFYTILGLAVFGPSVEGRVRTAKYLGFYFLTGVVGEILAGIVSPNIPGLGASGAVMGVFGMYLYLFPHSKIQILSLINVRPRILQWYAQWPIIFYTLFDFWYGSNQAKNGIGYICHLGGMAVGYSAMLLLKESRDTADQSRAEELIETAKGNLSTLTMIELAIAYNGSPDNSEIALTYCLRAARDGARRKAVEIMNEREAVLAECSNPHELAYVILNLGAYDGNPPPWLILRIASRMGAEDPGLAEALYWRLLKNRPRPTGDVLEKSLLHLAGLLEVKEKQREEASALYFAVMQLFPVNDSAIVARFKVKELGKPRNVAFSLYEGKIIPIENMTAIEPVQPEEMAQKEPAPVLESRPNPLAMLSSDVNVTT